MALEIPIWNSRIFQFETVVEQQSSFLVTDLLLDPYTCKGDYQEMSIYFFISSCLKQVAYFIIMLFKLKLILMVTTSQFYLTVAGELFEPMIHG